MKQAYDPDKVIAADPADAYKLILDDGPWEDTDDRRAQEYAERSRY